MDGRSNSGEVPVPDPITSHRPPDTSVLRSSATRNEGGWPSLTALCPTFGRFQRLRDAVACFLLQDYPGQKSLIILNDAPVRIVPGGAPGCVRVINHPERLPTLGHKRQALLAAADTPLVAHWDDDDLYLPWHLTVCVSALTGRPWPPHAAVDPSFVTCHSGSARCAKPRAAWYAVGPSPSFDVRGPCHNVFEGQMVFDRQRALENGGYPPLHSGQAKALLHKFGDAGELYAWNPPDRDIGYVYRWGDGADHVSARKGLTCDDDFGGGAPLVPESDPVAWASKRLESQFRRLAEGVQGRCNADEAETIRDRLRHALETELVAKDSG